MSDDAEQYFTDKMDSDEEYYREHFEPMTNDLTKLTNAERRPNLNDLKNLAMGEEITVAWLQYVEALERRLRELTEWRDAGDPPDDNRFVLLAFGKDNVHQGAYASRAWWLVGMDTPCTKPPKSWRELPAYEGESQ